MGERDPKMGSSEEGAEETVEKNKSGRVGGELSYVCSLDTHPEEDIAVVAEDLRIRVVLLEGLRSRRFVFDAPLGHSHASLVHAFAQAATSIIGEK